MQLNNFMWKQSKLHGRCILYNCKEFLWDHVSAALCALLMEHAYPPPLLTFAIRL